MPGVVDRVVILLRKPHTRRTQVPNLTALMDQCTICDNYLTDYAGNSFPNHCFAIGADAEWAYTNPNSTHKPVIKAAGVPKQRPGARGGFVRGVDHA